MRIIKRSLLIAPLLAGAYIPANVTAKEKYSQTTILSVHKCQTHACNRRVAKRIIKRRWRILVHRYGEGLLNARMQCESGNDGGYKLSTTGNSYWFAHQMNIGAWIGAGGRIRHGRPVGVWSIQPTKLEQNIRTIRWERIHGGDAWPNCP
jgi:hypothetical protein